MLHASTQTAKPPLFLGIGQIAPNVEVLPQETESHTMLAEIRQNQNRWDDAIGHWQRVAELRALEPTGPLDAAARRPRRAL